MNKRSTENSETEYTRSNGHSYMVCKNERLYDEYDIHMLQENSIKNLLYVDVIAADGVEQYWYDITGLQALDEYLRGRLAGIKELHMIMQSLKEALYNCERYMLNEDKISLKPEDIFIAKVASKNKGDICAIFCYKPFLEQDLGESLTSFTEYFLTIMDHSDGDEVKRCYEAYEKLRAEKPYIGEIITILEGGVSTEKDIETSTVKQDDKSYEKEESQNKESNLIRIYSEESEGLVDKIKKYGKRVFEGRKRKTKDIKRKTEKQDAYQMDEELLFVAEPGKYNYDNEEKTVLLGAKEEGIVGRLIYRGFEDEDSFLLDKEEYILGSAKPADGLMKSKAVSKLHARIRRMGSDYFLSDMNSRNGTSVNGEDVNYKEEVPLKKNDIIKFADCEYLLI